MGWIPDTRFSNRNDRYMRFREKKREREDYLRRRNPDPRPLKERDDKEFGIISG